MLTNLPQPLRQVLLTAVYLGGLVSSLWIAFQLRFDFSVPADYFSHPAAVFGGLIGTKLLLLVLTGQLGSLLTYFGFSDLFKILFVCAASAGCALIVWLAAGVHYAPPRAVVLTDFLLSFLFLCAFRLSLRLLREGYFNSLARPNTRKRVAILGAGDVGASLVQDFHSRRGLGMLPVAFFDDDRNKWGISIHGVTVIGPPELLASYVTREKLDEVIIAMPSAAGRRVRQLVALLNTLHLRFAIVPSYQQLLTGKIRVSQTRQVEIEDLLGRDPVNLETGRIRELIAGKVVMVTGAGGTIGSELCRQIALHQPREILLVERSEFLLFQIEQEFRSNGYGAEIVPLVADVLDPHRMGSLFRRFRPAVVFHAAAHKHVPLMEQQPAEALRNNVGGTQILADLAVEHQVERFVLISTDKAINPTNVMGATKRVAELYVQAMQTLDRTKFIAVRFGNVLGSSGSVIPTFKRQIAAGGPVTVTHPEVTRFFMTVGEAVGLVLQSATLGHGGEIFVLDMGRPMKIVDLARQLISLSGLEPDRDVEIKFTGLRPGEKLYEELHHASEQNAPTDHPKILRFRGPTLSLEALRESLRGIETNAFLDSSAKAKGFLRDLVPEYTPYVDVQ
jgi:FlaA1/EpsC-like NDP-sugar epimerase